MAEASHGEDTRQGKNDHMVRQEEKDSGPSLVHGTAYSHDNSLTLQDQHQSLLR
jgi:hypothetical protein